MRNFKFVKENDYRWFAEIPEWEGDRDELEMVMGADTMLDIISQGEDQVYVSLSTEEFKGYEYLLTLKEEAYEGGNYHLVGKNVEFDVWLCHVTKFVFGELPVKIYIK
jgi:hypothetical protein